MKNPLVQEAAAALSLPETDRRIRPLQGGLINYSFVINEEGSKPVFLQQINKQVFPDVQAIAHNYQLITAALTTPSVSFSLPQPLPFNDGSLIWNDSQGESWRATLYIRSTVFHSVTDPVQLEQTARAFGDFTRSLHKAPLAAFQYPIVDFHNLTLRYQQYEEALEKGDPSRLRSTRKEQQQLLARAPFVKLFGQMIDAPSDFNKRIMHHDAKISNLLFDESGKKLLAITDLDTAMPGFFFSDLGDMIRSMAASTHEDDARPESVAIDPAAYKTLTQGYARAMNTSLTASESEWLHASGLLMIYMQALRFMTDHLWGDRYYHITRPGQNLQRATHQLTLLLSLESHLQKEYGFSIT